MATIGLASQYNSFKAKTAHSNLDYWYGPYNSVEEALIMVDEDVRDIGLTVGINQFIKNNNGTYVYVELVDEVTGKTYHTYIEDLENLYTDVDKYSFYEIEEYQWKRNTANLEKKGESSLILELITDSRIRIQENTPIQIEILGGITPNSIEVYEVINDQEFLTNYSYPGTIPLNNIISLNLNITGNPRTIVYRIKVTDKNNQYAKTIEDKNYVEVTVDFKEIEINNLNTIDIQLIKLKNTSNLQNKTFSFDINTIYYVTSYSPRLMIGDTQIENAITRSGNSFVVQLPSDLSNFGGQTISIIVDYISENQGHSTNPLNIITLLAPGVFTNVNTELQGTSFYIDNRIPMRIYFEGEQETTYRIQSTENSDFFYNGFVTSYTWNTIYINPNKVTPQDALGINFYFTLGDSDKVENVYIKNGKITNFSRTIYEDPNKYTLDQVINLSSSFKPKSFILDLYCFINYSQSEDNIFQMGNITINKNIIRFGNIVYPIPLQQEVHLGFEYQVTDNTSIIDSKRTVYNAIYINGVLCKNVKLDTTEYQNEGPDFKGSIITNNITILGFNLYYDSAFKSPFTNILFENTQAYVPILYNNYLAHTKQEEESVQLPVLELRALNKDDEKYDIINQSKLLVPSEFGTLEDGQVKYDARTFEATPNSETEGFDVLLKQTTDLKKQLQKSRGVLCQYAYKIGLTTISEGLVEVHTQGTSTLTYRLPNFKFTFLNPETLKKLKVNIVPGYNESVLTAKADYMDSSHLNNTPTASYYNKIIHSGVIENQSPSAKNNGLDAITGTPIILQIQDVGKTELVNYGSFMLNIDKTGDALKFQIEEDIDDCISFEGTSNAPDKEFSSRFQIVNYADYPTIVNDFTTVNTNINNLSGLYYCNEVKNGTPMIYTNNGTIVREDEDTDNSYNCRKAIFSVLSYLSEGLEYRYPDGDMIKVKSNKVSLMPLEHFIRLFKVFYWTATSANLSKEDYKEQFVQYYNYEYCALYFIMLMVFGQTDNLGKNCMFDQWYDPDKEYDTEKDILMYPRPYDLDSEIGLDNNGNDNIPPFLEISPIFSLNYDVVYNNFSEQTEYSTLEEYLNANYLTNSSELPYEGTFARRYSFSSATSQLWINFYKNFKTEIRETYKKLRNYKVNNELEYDENGEHTLLSSETIIDFYQEFVTNAFGKGQYNIDFQLKYLGDIQYQNFAYGNRQFKFRDWITKRLQFCDTYFYYRSFETQLNNVNIKILLNSPQYVITNYQGGSDGIYFFNGIDEINFNSDISTSGLKYTFYINPEAILDSNIYSVVTDSIPKMPFNSIVNLSTTGNQLSRVLDITNSQYLKSLTIQQLNIHYNQQLPSNIQTINLSNCTALLDISNLPYLKTVTINKCQSTGETLRLNNLNPDGIELIINDSKLNLDIQNVKINKLTFSNNTINSLNINNCEIPEIIIKNQSLGSVTFSGDGSIINKLDLRGCTFTNSLLNITTISNNVEHLLLNDTTGLINIVSETPLNNLKFLGLMNSEVETFSTSQQDNSFDGSLLPNTLPYSVYCQNYTEKGVQTSASFTDEIIYNIINRRYYSGNQVADRKFNLEQTNIVHVKNLNITDSEITKLFTNCEKLESVTLSRIQCNTNKMFRNCINLSNIQIDNTYGITSLNNSASKMFNTCNALPYSIIRQFLQKNPNITDFTNMLVNKKFTEDTTIYFSDYNNATDLSSAFRFNTLNERGLSQQTISTTSEKDERIVITFKGTIPTSVQNISEAFAIYPNYIQFDNWDNLIKNCSQLKDMRAAFYNLKSNVENKYYTVNTNWFPTTASLNMNWAFQSTPVFLENFQFKSNVTNCMGTFAGSSCPDKTYDVSQVFVNATSLVNASRCFYNNSSAYTNSALVLPNVNREIYIPGIFNGCKNIYGEISGKYCGYYSGEYTSNWGSVVHTGIFESCLVNLDNGYTYEYESSRLDRLFCNATLNINYTGEENEQHSINFIFDSPDILYIMYRSKLNSDEKAKKTIEVELRNTKRANYAFEVTSTPGYLFKASNDDEVYPPALPSSIIDATRMFYYQNITQIPIDYFRSENGMFTNLTTTVRMFEYSKLKNLPRSTEYGLMPTSITDMDYMFENNSNLKGGIPKNFFNKNRNLTHLNYVFYNTLILSNCDEYNNPSGEFYGYLNLNEQLPNLKSVSYLFYRNFPNVTNVQVIDSESFYNCTVLSGVLRQTPDYKIYENVNGTYVQRNKMILKAPVNLTRSFVGFDIKELTIEDYSNLTNIQGLFALITNVQSTNPSESKKEIIKQIIGQLLTIDPTLSTITYISCMSKWTRDETFLEEMLGEQYNSFTTTQKNRFYQVDTSIPLST